MQAKLVEILSVYDRSSCTSKYTVDTLVDRGGPVLPPCKLEFRIRAMERRSRSPALSACKRRLSDVCHHDRGSISLNIRIIRERLDDPAYTLVLQFPDKYPPDPTNLVPHEMLLFANTGDTMKCYMLPVPFDGSKFAHAVSILERAVNFAYTNERPTP